MLGAQRPGTGITHGCELWMLGTEPLFAARVASLLATEPLQPQGLSFKN